jgi:hypothetical protein
MCNGAKRFTRTTHFRPNGYLIRYQNQEIVDDCHCYLLVDAHTFVSLGDPGQPDVSLHFTIKGNELRFDVVLPDPCSTRKCRHAIAFAVGQYALGPWHRIS